MKKLSILLTGALALAAFTACDDAPEAAAPQKNPQPAIFTNADVEATFAGPLAEASADGAAPLNLQDYREAGVITLMDNVTISDIPTGAEVVFELQISPDQNFAVLPSTTPLLATVDSEGKAQVLTEDWNAAHYDLAGKSMTPKTFYYRVYGYISLDNTRYVIGTPDPADPSAMVPKGFAQGEYREIPFELIIDQAYYFVSNATTWNPAEASAFKFDHEGTDVYANPVFTFKFEVAQDVLDANGGGCYWKVASQTCIDNNSLDAAYGPSVNGDKSLSGKLIVGGGAGQITEAGKYTISINMEDLSYEIVKQVRPEYIVVASQANGWGQQGCSNLYWSDKEDADKQYFCGAAVVDNIYGFKFIWDGTWYGQDFSTADGAQNIQAPVDGTRLYWFTVDTEAPSYTIKEVTSLGLIGVPGWNENNDVLEMTPSEDCKTWTIENVQLSDAFKIIINHDWNSNYGVNSKGELAFAADNISGHAGLADVTLSFAGPRPELTVTAK